MPFTSAVKYGIVIVTLQKLRDFYLCGASRRRMKSKCKLPPDTKGYLAISGEDLKEIWGAQDLGA